MVARRVGPPGLLAGAGVGPDHQAGRLQRAKSQAKLPLRTPVRLAALAGPPELLAAARAAEGDLAAAGRVAAFEYRERPEAATLEVRVELAAPEEATT